MPSSISIWVNVNCKDVRVKAKVGYTLVFVMLKLYIEDVLVKVKHKSRQAKGSLSLFLEK